jgi:hypothetical protein
LLDRFPAVHGQFRQTASRSSVVFIGSRIPEHLRLGCAVHSPQNLIFVTATAFDGLVHPLEEDKEQEVVSGRIRWRSNRKRPLTAYRCRFQIGGREKSDSFDGQPAHQINDKYDEEDGAEPNACATAISPSSIPIIAPASTEEKDQIISSSSSSMVQTS